MSPSKDMRNFTPGNLGYPLLAFVLYALTQIVAIVAGLVVFALWTGPESTQGGAWFDWLMTNFKAHFHLFSLLYSIIQIGVFCLMLHLLRRRGTPYVFLRKPQKGGLAAAVMLALGGLGLSQIWTLLVTTLGRSIPFFREATESYSDVTSILTEPGSVVLLVISVGICVPIAEELLFRGILLSELKLFLPTPLAIVFSGLVFGLFHGNVLQGVYATVLGMLIATVYIWTESLYMAIAMHVTFNLFGGVLPVLLQAYKDVRWVETAYIGFTLLCFLIAIPVFLWLARNRRPAQTVARGSLVYWRAYAEQHGMAAYPQPAAAPAVPQNPDNGGN